VVLTEHLELTASTASREHRARQELLETTESMLLTAHLESRGLLPLMALLEMLETPELLETLEPRVSREPPAACRATRELLARPVLLEMLA
jgi:hypothetical protein